MSNYYEGQVLHSNYNGFRIIVTKVSTTDKGVTVEADGKEVSTTENYLDGFYHEPGTRTPTSMKEQT